MRIAALEPTLWIHLITIALIPIGLEVTWLALAASEPIWYWLEYVLLAAVTILPGLVMQWVRPFDIFSLGLVSLRPQQLSQSQRQILNLLKTRKTRIIALTAAILLLWLLRQLYVYAPLAASVTPIGAGRIWGVIVAAIAYSITNILVQVSLSVVGIMLSSEAQLANTAAIEVEQVTKEFLVPGLKLNQIPLISNKEVYKAANQ